MLDVLVKSFPYLLRGALETLWLAGVSVTLSILLGALLGVLVTFAPPLLRWPITGYVLVIRAVPVLVLMFLAYYALPALGLASSEYVAVLGALVLYGGGFVTEITRGAILAVPRSQIDAARALGMVRRQVLREVVLPQALRMSLPALLNIVVILVKSTAYASIVGAWELSFASREIVERTLAPFQIFFGVMVLYFLMCWPLSLVARGLERRFGFAQ